MDDFNEQWCVSHVYAATYPVEVELPFFSDEDSVAPIRSSGGRVKGGGIFQENRFHLFLCVFFKGIIEESADFNASKNIRVN